MLLTCLGSSSKGNCYLLSHRGETLVIEAGVSLLEVKKALHFKIGGMVGCVVSHRHDDHAKYVNDFLKSGIKVLAPQDVFEHKNIDNPFAHVVKPMRGYVVGNFKVLPLSVAHDVPCVGFLIEHPAMGKTFFLTDTMMLEYRLPEVNHLMIEANYADDILRHNIDNGIVPVSMRDRLLLSHMELQTTKDVIKANDMSLVNEIVLLHLSDDNSHAERFADEIRSVSGKPAYVASKGLEIPFDIDPY